MYNFKLQELESSPEYRNADYETRQQVVQEYLSQNGPDEAVGQFKELLADPEYLSLPPEKQQSFKQDYKSFYGLKELPLEDVSFGTDVKDVMLSGLAGTSAIPKATAMVAGWVGAGGGKEKLLEIAKTTENYYNSKLSSQGKEVKQQKFLSEEDGKWFGNNAIKKVFMTSAESLPLMLATAPVGGGASAALSKAKFLPDFIRALDGGGKVGKWSHQMLTYGASEAGMSALVSSADAGEKVASMSDSVINKSPVYRELLKTMSPEDARKELRGIVESETFMTQAAATLAGGAIAPGGAMPKLFQGSGKGLVRETVEGFGQEAAQEAGQSGLETVGDNLTTRRNLDPLQRLSEGVGESIALGAASGGLMGGAMGGGKSLITVKQAEQAIADIPFNADPEEAAAAIEAATTPETGNKIVLGELSQEEMDDLAAFQQITAKYDLEKIMTVQDNVLPNIQKNNPVVAPHVERILKERFDILASQIKETPIDQDQINTDDLMDDFAETEQSIQDQADERARKQRFERLKETYRGDDLINEWGSDAVDLQQREDSNGQLALPPGQGFELLDEQEAEIRRGDDLINTVADDAITNQQAEDAKVKRPALPPGQGFELVGEPKGPKKPDVRRNARIPREIRDAVAKMESDLASGDSNGVITEGKNNSQTVTGGYPSTNPDWFKTSTVKQYDAENGTDYAKHVNKKTIKGALHKVRAGLPLPKSEQKAWGYVQAAAQIEAKTDPELIANREFTKLEKEGFEFEAPEKIVVGNLEKGDEVVVIGKNGIPDKLTHKGRENGNIVLQDGIRMEVDEFDQIETIAKKVKDGENTPIDPASVAENQEGNGTENSSDNAGKTTKGESQIVEVENDSIPQVDSKKPIQVDPQTEAGTDTQGKAASVPTGKTVDTAAQAGPNEQIEGGGQISPVVSASKPAKEITPDKEQAPVSPAPPAVENQGGTPGRLGSRIERPDPTAQTEGTVTPSAPPAESRQPAAKTEQNKTSKPTSKPKLSTSSEVASFREANNLPEIKMRKDGSHPTQIATTKSTYRKIFDKHMPKKIKEGRILDFGAGKNIGGKELGIETFEPFPESGFNPTFTDTNNIPSDSFDGVISNAVLNVVPDDIRSAIVKEIGRVLAVNGKAYINVRGKDVFNANHTVINKEKMEVIITGNGAYQKGFDQKELVDYLENELGAGFSVIPANFGTVGAIITKSAQSKKSQSTLPPTGQDSISEDANPFNYKVHNGQTKQASILEEVLDGKYRVIPWRMPGSLVKKDQKGRVNMDGLPKSDLDLSERLAKIFRKEIIWVSIGDKFSVHGVMVPDKPLDKYIFIDVRTPLPAHIVLGHELAHFLETEHTMEYSEMWSVVSPLIKNIPEYRDKLKLFESSEFDIRKEIIADLLGDSFGNTSFFEQVAQQSPGKFKSIARKIVSWISSVINKFRTSGFRSEMFVSDLTKTRAALARLIAQTIKKPEASPFPATDKENLSVPKFAVAPNQTSDDTYRKARQGNTFKGKAIRNTKKVLGGVLGGVDKYLGASSTRLRNIDPKIEHKFRKLDYDTGTKLKEDVQAVLPMLNKAKSKMSKNDYADWDFARKNSDTDKINELLDKYEMHEEYEAYRETLNNLRDEANSVGMDIGWIKEYAPRIISDEQGFLNAVNKGSMRPIITDAIKKRAEFLEISVADMSPEMRADIVSNLLFGGFSGVGKPGNAKERTIKKIPAHLNQYYMDSDGALVSYLHSIRKHVEMRKFFGKLPKVIADVKRAMHQAEARLRVSRSWLNEASEQREAGIQETIDSYRAILDRYKNERDYKSLISEYIDSLIIDKTLSPENEQTLMNIFNARFHEKGTHGLIQAYKNLSYIDTMGNVISAVTQIGDLAWTLYANGWMRTAKGIYGSITNNARITKEDVGIERIAQEFAGGDTLSKAVAKVFKWVGLEKMDTIGKESFLNAALERFENQATKNPEKLRQQLKDIYEDETDSLISDLQNKRITENVKLLVYSNLLDFQPAALSEQSEKYLDAGNGRLFYMLKSYTLKQFDVFRREVYTGLKSGDKAQTVKAMRNLVYLSSLLVLANGGADEIKDFILGRKTSFEDRVVDNVLRLFGVSKYVTWKARTDGVGSAMVRQILPPFKFLDSLSKDVISAGDEKGLEVLNSVPVVGKIAYWHIGRGATKGQDYVEKKFNKKKKKLEDIAEKVRTDPQLKSKYIDDLREYSKVKDLQKKITRQRREINEMKKYEKKTGKDLSKRIKAAEETRLKTIEDFLNKENRIEKTKNIMYNGLGNKKESNDLLTKLRETRDRIFKLGKPTDLIDKKIMKVQTDRR